MRHENFIKNLFAKPEGKRPLGRPMCRWEDYIRMDVREIGWDGVDWMHLAHERDQWRVLVKRVTNVSVP
jgi:hypothetical protein